MTLTALVGSVALAAGCSQGGGGSPRTAGSSSTAPGSTVGPVSSALPAPNRATAYAFDTLYEPVSIPGGTITAMTTAPVGTAVLVADSPFSYVSRVDNGQGSQEGKLYFDATGFAHSDAEVFAATGSRDAPGAADLWVRDANRAWSVVLDTNDSRMAVASLGTAVYAASGTPGGGTTVHLRGNGSAGAFTNVAWIDSAVPTAAAAFDGEVWFGITQDRTLGGRARLAHGSGMVFTERTLPAAAVGMNVEQRVTAMLSIATVASGSKAGTNALAIAVGEFHAAGGEALSGSVILTNGALFETIANFSGDAPTALAFHDDTIYVALRSGALKFRQADGTWEDEPGLPANRGIASLLSRDDELLIGAAGDLGATVIRRVGGQGATPPPPPPPPPHSGDYYFLDDVKPLLAASCASCHDGGLPLAAASFPLTSPANDSEDYAQVLARVNTASPADSLFLLKAANDSSAGSHAGGQIFARGSAEFTLLETWITQGAEYEDVSAPPPPPPPPAPKTFVVDVHPLLQADCMGCHGAGNVYTINANQSATYSATVARTDQGSPANSLLLRKASGAAVHGGGQINGYAAGQPKYEALLQWIQDGVQLQ